MNDSEDAPIRYRVVYSELVRAGLVRQASRAKAAGLYSQFLASLKELDRRLQIYPQFGDPLFDLELESAQAWMGVVPPLVVRYVIDEARRTVFIVRPILLLPRSGF